MPLDLRTLNAAEANAEKLLDTLKAIRLHGAQTMQGSIVKPKLNKARAIVELLDEQVHNLYNQAKEKQ